MSIKISGLDELQRKLEGIARRARELDGTHNVPLNDLATPEFMRHYTDFSSINEMMEASGFQVRSIDDFKQIPDDEWDAFIARRTRFSTWKEFLQKAGVGYIKDKLGF
jgi:hypothetical protein